MSDYPTEEQLQTIKNWGIIKNGTINLLDYVKSIWRWADIGYFNLNGRELELHTGGWSGNEDIIEALMTCDNGLFWILYWQKSTRGGHYWFRILHTRDTNNSK